MREGTTRDLENEILVMMERKRLRNLTRKTKEKSCLWVWRGLTRRRELNESVPEKKKFR